MTNAARVQQSTLARFPLLLLLLVEVLLVTVVSSSFALSFVAMPRARLRFSLESSAMGAPAEAKQKTCKIYARAIAHHKLSKCFFGDLLAQIEF